MALISVGEGAREISDEVRQVRQELVRAGLLGDVRTDGVVPDGCA